MRKILQLLLTCIIVGLVYVASTIVAAKHPSSAFIIGWVGGVLATLIGVIVYLLLDEI